MAVGKSKKMVKKGNKKKVIDPFLRKEWYDVKAPSIFTTRQIGKTLVNRTQGTRIASDFLKGRVYEVSLGDLNTTTDADFKKFRLVCEDVQGRECLTNFHSMSFTHDKMCSIVRKWHTLIEGSTAVRTTDGYLLRVFCVAFTKRDKHQIKKAAYAQSSKVRAIRARMDSVIKKEVSGGDLKGFIKKIIAGSIELDIQKRTKWLHPLENVYINKIKVLKKPKFEHGRLLDLHSEVNVVVNESGAVVSRPDAYEPPVLSSV
uniref:Small ribosomal subunit protein eS1 n=1 Tax=Panagrellus redivivus TaxID=6233 RepID=A0A7E4WCW7_PANRE